MAPPDPTVTAVSTPPKLRDVMFRSLVFFPTLPETPVH